MTYTNKTQPTSISAESFLMHHFADHESVQKQARILIKTYTQIAGSACVMWGKIFGFGTYRYYDSRGGEHEHLMTGFAISKTGFTLYNLMGWENYQKDIETLGEYKLSGTSCLAIKSVMDIDLTLLAAVMQKALGDMQKKYQTTL